MVLKIRTWIFIRAREEEASSRCDDALYEAVAHGTHVLCVVVFGVPVLCPPGNRRPLPAGLRRWIEEESPEVTSLLIDDAAVDREENHRGMQRV